MQQLAKTFMERTLEENRGEIYFDIIPRFALKIYELCLCVLMVNALFKLPRDISFCLMSITVWNNKTFLFSGMLMLIFNGKWDSILQLLKMISFSSLSIDDQLSSKR